MSHISTIELANGLTVAKTRMDQLVDLGQLTLTKGAADRCTIENLNAALSHLEGVEVVSAQVNRTGRFTVPQDRAEILPTPEHFTDLPDFCDVRVRHRLAGGHFAEITVWVPLAWNRRFAATGGQGSLTGPLYMDDPALRALTLPVALRNGFATAATDAGNRGTRINDWPVDPSTGALDWDLLNAWLYQATHDMAVVAKALIEALQGEPPAYSYYIGGSGGGRQGLASVRRFPEDFDGVWVSDPALFWTRMCPAILWPALVMKELGTAVPDAKFEAFRAAALESLDGADGAHDGFLGAFDPTGFEAAALVGALTSAGEITPADAKVMQMIWDGPKRGNGEQIWHGLRPGAQGWGMLGPSITQEVDGVLQPVGNPLGTSYFGWVLEDPDFDWTTLTFERFEELTDVGVQKFAAAIDGDDPDLSGLAAAGGKLLMSQAVDDSLIKYQGTIDYYQRAIDALGGPEAAGDVVRLFLTEGDIHGFCMGPGPGISIGSGIIALMTWVENGLAPEEITAERFDPTSGEVAATRPAYLYPAVPRYNGAGDIAAATSYHPEG